MVIGSLMLPTLRRLALACCLAVAACSSFLKRGCCTNEIWSKQRASPLALKHGAMEIPFLLIHGRLPPISEHGGRPHRAALEGQVSRRRPMTGPAWATPSDRPAVGSDTLALQAKVAARVIDNWA